MTQDTHSHLPKPEPYQRLGSGDGEREASMTRQMPFEPLPASVLFARCWLSVVEFIAQYEMGDGWAELERPTHRASRLMKMHDTLRTLSASITPAVISDPRFAHKPGCKDRRLKDKANGVATTAKQTAANIAPSLTLRCIRTNSISASTGTIMMNNASKHAVTAKPSVRKAGALNSAGSI